MHSSLSQWIVQFSCCIFNRTAMSRKRRKSCLWVTGGVLLGLGLLFLILGLTVFKPKDPITTVNSISLSDMDFAVDALRPRVRLNITLGAVLTVENPNRVGFRYTNSTGNLRYRGNDVGQVPIPAGRIGARENQTWSFEMAVMADRLITDGDFYSDAISGTLRFQLLVRLAGKVRVVVGIRLVAYALCDLDIHLLSRSLYNQTCHYRAKL